MSTGSVGGGDKIPGDEEIEKAKSLVNYRNPRIEGGEAYLEREGMMIDLGGDRRVTLWRRP